MESNKNILMNINKILKEKEGIFGVRDSTTPNLINIHHNFPTSVINTVECGMFLPNDEVYDEEKNEVGIVLKGVPYDEDDIKYPVLVKFKGYEQSYTIDGRANEYSDKKVLNIVDGTRIKPTYNDIGKYVVICEDNEHFGFIGKLNNIKQGLFFVNGNIFKEVVLLNKDKSDNL